MSKRLTEEQARRRRVIAAKPLTTGEKKRLAMCDFVKQYGIMRSGTNWVSRLIVKNFHVIFFSNFLGCKHAPLCDTTGGGIVDFKLWTKQLEDRWIRAALSKGRGFNDDVDLQKLKFVLTVRDPYSWTTGWMKHWNKNHKPRFKLNDVKKHKGLCREFNRRYRLWRKFCEHPAIRDRIVVVKLEDAQKDFKGVLEILKEKLGLKQKGSPDYANEPHIVTGAGRVLKDRIFDSTYYLERKYLQEIPEKVLRTITSTIDWELLGWYGYKAV